MELLFLGILGLDDVCDDDYEGGFVEGLGFLFSFVFVIVIVVFVVFEDVVILVVVVLGEGFVVLSFVLLFSNSSSSSVFCRFSLL